MKTLYLFSGLGADRRVFDALDFTGAEVRHIEWTTPLPNESMPDYAKRITAQIATPNPILIGLSFGGMMAVEVAKHIKTERILLISSAKGKSEIPGYYRWLGILGLHKLVPDEQVTKASWLLYWLFGTRNAEDRKLLAAILADTDPVFFKWAIHNIVTWKEMRALLPIVHIHGSADRILPCCFIKADHILPGGGHLMVVNRAKEINAIIKKYWTEDL